MLSVSLKQNSNLKKKLLIVIKNNDIPEELLLKAISISEEMKKLGHEKWQLAGIADRSLINELDGIIVACYRAFCQASSDTAKGTAIQLLERYIKNTNKTYYYPPIQPKYLW